MLKNLIYSLLVMLLLFSVRLFADTKVALIIGNSSYQSASLKNPLNDANDMAKMLTRFGFDVTLQTDLDQRSMNKAVSHFGKQLKDADVALFFYAGHAMQVNGNNYLLPLDAKIESEDEIPYQTLNMGLVLAKMQSARSKVNIIILDACRDNPFANSFSRSVSSRGLVRVSAPTGSMVVYATAPNQTAADGKGRNGPFTQHFLKNMAIPNIDLNEVVLRTRIGVIETTGGKQIPWNESSLTQKFYFYKDANAKTEPDMIAVTLPENTVTEEADIWADAFQFDIEVETDDENQSITFYAQGESTANDLVSRKITSNKNALKKVKKFLYKALAKAPYKLKRSQINTIYDNGEQTELEYSQEGKIADVGYKIVIEL